MGTPEVKVRLSAEGLAEVVTAFRTIGVAGTQAGAKAKGAFLPVGGTISLITGLVATLSAAIATIGFARMADEVRDTAEQMQLMSTRFATSVVDLTALDVALRRNGTSLFEQQRALTTFFNKTQQAADLGGEAANQLRALGLSTKEIADLGSKDLAGRLEAVGTAFAKLPDGPERAARALALVSVGGGALIPILKQVGEEGFDALYAKAERFGLLLDTDTVNAIGNLKDIQEDLSLQSRGFATQFLAGFAEPMVSAFQAISGEISSSTEFWRALGEVVGETLGGALVLATKLADAIGTMFQTLGKSLVYAGKATRAFLVNDQETLKLELESIGLVWEQAREDLNNRFKVADARFKDKLAATRAARDRGKTAGGEDFDRLAAERAAIREAAADADLKISAAAIKRLEAQQDAAFEKGLLSVQEYYERRRVLAVKGIDAELEAVAERENAARASESGLKLEASLKKFDGERRRLLIERAAALEEIGRKEQAELLRVAAARLQADEKVAQTAEEQHAVRMRQIDDEIEKLRVLLVQDGLHGAELEAILSRSRATREAAADFELRAAGANSSLADFSRAREAIQARIAAGVISEVSGNEQLLELSKERLAVLADLGAELLRIARVSGDAGKIEDAEKFLQSVDAIALSVQSMEDSWARIRSASEDALVDGLATFLSEGERDAQNFGQAIGAMAASVVQSLRRIIAQMIALRLVSGFLRAFGALAGGGGGGTFGAGDGALGEAGQVFAAEGGLISGPGGPMADAIPARLSAGEYVVRASAVAQPGVLQALESINRGIRAPLGGWSPQAPVRRFAEGGLVSGAGLSAPASRVEIGGEVRVGLEDGLVARAVESPAGQRAVVRAVVENRRTVRRALG